MKIWNAVLGLLQSYGVLIASIVIGISLSLLKPNWLSVVDPFGVVYFNLLKMWALPIMLTSLILSISKFVRQGKLGAKANSIFTAVWTRLFLIFVIIFLTAFVFETGQNVSDANLRRMGSLINQTDNLTMDLMVNSDIVQPNPTGLLDFVATIVPDNIFEALNESVSIQVVSFALLFGLALGWARSLENAVLPTVLERTYQTMSQLTGWIGVLVPFGLCIQVADLARDVKLDNLLALADFIVIVCVLFILISVFSIGIIWQRSGFSLPFVLSSLGEPSLLVLSSQDAVSAIPSSITALNNSLRFDRSTVDLVIPLAITILRMGSFVYLVQVTFFIAGLYDIPLGLGKLIIMIVGIGLGTTATSTATGGDDLILVILPVLSFLGLPLEAVIVPLVAIDLILQPLRELTTVHAGMALTALMSTTKLPSQPSPKPSPKRVST